MSLSLREQLLQAGLGTKKQAKQANQQSRDHRNQPRNQPPPPSPQALAAQKAQAAKVAHDQELNRRKQEKAQKKARRAAVRQLIEQNRLPKLETDDWYNFVDGKMIRRTAVDPQRREQLTRGEMVLVRYSGHYEMVPAAIIPRIKEIDEQVIVPTNVAAPAADTVDENDPYKDFVVPDDLTW